MGSCLAKSVKAKKLEHRVQGLSSERKKAINEEHQAGYTRAMRDVEKMRGKMVERLEERGITDHFLEGTGRLEFIPLEDTDISQCISTFIKHAEGEQDIALIRQVNSITDCVPAGSGYPRSYFKTQLRQIIMQAS